MDDNGLENKLKSICLIVILAHSLPFLPDTGTDVMFFDIEFRAVDPLFVSFPYKGS
jgi:hypothetical protein